MSVFISYRRGPLSDTMGRRLQQWLQDELHASVYRDVASIQIGAKFREHLEGALASCSVGLVLIDPDWDIPRLHAADDWVRMEIEHMLSRRIPLASVLLGGARPPGPEELPQSLRPLLEHPAYPLSAGDTFDVDIIPIGRFVSHQFSARKPSSLPIVLGTIAGVLLVAGSAIAAYQVRDWIVGFVAGASVGEGLPDPSPAQGGGSPPGPLNEDPARSSPTLAPSASSTPTPAPMADPHVVRSASRGPTPTPRPASATVVDQYCSEVCLVEGRCALVDGMLGQGCIAASEADCRKSSACARSGLCSLGDRVCSARSDADCSESTFCRSDGRCRAHEGRCEALSDADCLGASRCIDDGKCSRFTTGICGYGTDADCARSRKCKERGACTYRNTNWCVATKDSDCANSTGCKTAGLCKLRNDDCRPGSAKDCEQSTHCKNHGECVVNEFGSGCKRPPPPSDQEAATPRSPRDQLDGGGG